MAVQLDAAADRLTHSGTYPQTSAGWTYTAWVRIDTDRNDWSVVLRLFGGGGTIATCGTSSSGTGGPTYYTALGSAESTTDLSSPSTGVWVPIAATRAASGNTISAWCKRSGTGSTIEVRATLSQTDVTDTPTGICLGGRGPADATEWLNGSLAYVRVWSVALTQAEIEAEWASPVPVKTSGLHSNWPLSTATDLTDTVGSKTLAVQSGGSLTTVTGPSIGPTGTTGVIDGALPTLGGSLAATVGTSGALQGALPTLGGSLTAEIGSAGALQGSLPVLSGSLTAELGASGVLGGALPFLGGTLASSVETDGAIAGSLPTLGGQLTGSVSTVGTIGGNLPSLAGSLTGSNESPTITGVIQGALPTLSGQLVERVVWGVRELVFLTLSEDSALNALGFDADSIFTDHSVDTPQRRPFMVLRWQSVALGVGPVNQRTLQVWVHDRHADYERIDQALRRLRTLFGSFEAVRLAGGTAGLHTALWEGDSDDLRDDEARTVTRWAQFRLTGSAF